MKWKILLIAVFFFAISGAVLKVVENGILFPGFQAAQQKAVDKDLQRCIRALKRELKHLDTLCWDWASWDDTYAFMQARDEAFIRSNLVASTFTDNRLQLIQFVAPSGDILWGETRDPASGDPLAIDPIPKDRYPASSPLVFSSGPFARHKAPFVAGFLSTDKGPMLLASRPVLTSENEGPPRGSVVMGRLLDAAFVDELGRQVLVDFDVMSTADADHSLHKLKLKQTLLSKKTRALYSIADGYLLADAVLKDVEGHRALVVRARIDPDLERIGIDTLHANDIVLILCGVGVTIFLLLVLHYTVVRPLAALTDYALDARSSGDIEKRIQLHRGDEIGVLAEAWDALLQQLAEKEDTIRKANRKLEQDVAEQKQAEIRIRHRENYYRTLMESMENDVLVVDADHKVTDGNREDFRVLAWDRSTVVGQRIEELWTQLRPSASGVEIAALLDEVFHTGTPAFSRFEGEIETLGHRILDIRLSPIRSGDRTSYVIVSIGDVTRQVKMDRLVNQMQKIEALGTMAAGISHEFNNILMSIILNVEAAMEQTDDPFQRESLQLSYQSALRARDLVRQMRIFSRQSSDPDVCIEANPLIRESLKMVKTSLSPSIRLHTDLQAEDNRLRIPPDQIQQILVNLCLNAAHAIGEKEGEIHVRTAQHRVKDGDDEADPDLAPGLYWVLSVVDTGAGMDNRTAKRIFDPFFTLKNRGEGTGLGLSVVHGIVTHHNGTVQVQSQPGQGTTLRVFLPQGAADAPPAPAPEPETAGTENTLSGIRLLMVDDEEVIVSSVRRVLENYGYIVVGAADGKQALRLFQENPSAFDVVISDVAMPGMSGVELAKELLSIRPEVPVILCSGYQDVPDASQLLQTGVRAVMKKPLNFSEIDAVIRQQLRRTH